MMRRTVFTLLALFCLAPAADAGLFKGKFKLRAKEKAAACPCVAATGSCPCDGCTCGQPANRATLSADTPTVWAAGPCANGQCVRTKKGR